MWEQTKPRRGEGGVIPGLSRLWGEHSVYALEEFLLGPEQAGVSRLMVIHSCHPACRYSGPSGVVPREEAQVVRCHRSIVNGSLNGVIDAVTVEEGRAPTGNCLQG